jgi:hypothetical protein
MSGLPPPPDIPDTLVGRQPWDADKGYWQVLLSSDEVAVVLMKGPSPVAHAAQKLEKSGYQAVSTAITHLVAEINSRVLLAVELHKKLGVEVQLDRKGKT